MTNTFSRLQWQTPFVRFLSFAPLLQLVGWQGIYFCRKSGQKGRKAKGE